MRLGPGTKPSGGLFEGWVEAVDSGEAFRFHSANELLQIMGASFVRPPRDGKANTGSIANEG